MNLTILTEYCQDDLNRTGDPCLVSLLEGDHVILSGDWYHDKIDDQITGFIGGVQYCGRIVHITKVAKTSEDY